MFGGTVPEDFTQDMTSGKNNIQSATVMAMGISYQHNDYGREEIRQLEEAIQNATDKFNKDSKHVNFFLFTQTGLLESFRSDIQDDLSLIQVALGLVAVYCIFFMGSCSPIHFRAAAAGIALLCVGLSYGASSGLAYFVGAKSAGVHNILPFLLIGIGVDDCFVIA